MSDFGVGVEAALGAIMSGDNVFVTGPGGSGKVTPSRPSSLCMQAQS